jgi:hypothetical protein
MESVTTLCLLHGLNELCNVMLGLAPTSCRDELPVCYIGRAVFPPPPQCGGGARSYYLMDVASVVPAVCLDVRPGHRVADFCSAPGARVMRAVGGREACVAMCMYACRGQGAGAGRDAAAGRGFGV